MALALSPSQNQGEYAPLPRHPFLLDWRTICYYLLTSLPFPPLVLFDTFSCWDFVPTIPKFNVFRTVFQACVFVAATFPALSFSRLLITLCGAFSSCCCCWKSYQQLEKMKTPRGYELSRFSSLFLSFSSPYFEIHFSSTSLQKHTSNDKRWIATDGSVTFSSRAFPHKMESFPQVTVQANLLVSFILGLVGWVVSRSATA